MAGSNPAYTIAGKLPVIATKDVKVTVMSYGPGQEVPWHSHSEITDTTFCLEGLVEVSLRHPDETVVLAPGGFRQIAPRCVHRVRCVGPGPCKALLVQGVGTYDFLPE